MIKTRPNCSYVTLASHYAGFLGDLGGVSITMLTLVLALGQKAAEPALFQLLVAALVVATTACFVGAHQMAETAATLPTSPAPGDATALERIEGGAGHGPVRLQMIASINVYIAGAAFLMSMVLLTAAYRSQGVTTLATQMAFWSFVFIQVGAYVWLARFTLLLRHPKGTITAGTAIILGLVLCVFVVFWGARAAMAEPVAYLSFGLCVAAIAASMIYYGSTYDRRDDPNGLDLWVFCLGSALPPAALLALGVKSWLT